VIGQRVAGERWMAHETQQFKCAVHCGARRTKRGLAWGANRARQFFRKG
jgi:hypothetical protein